jgi:hypothetical protein
VYVHARIARPRSFKNSETTPILPRFTEVGHAHLLEIIEAYFPGSRRIISRIFSTCAIVSDGVINGTICQYDGFRKRQASVTFLKSKTSDCFEA